ncbi:MAG: type II secretion system F family protein [Armatimonadota bacterium]|nr:type II secretion system F family protein [Armatimonadota bacterium]
MPMFRYSVVDKSGRTLNGVMSAKDEAELATSLMSKGYSLQSVVKLGPAPAVAATSPTVQRPSAPVDGVPPSLEPRIPMRTLAVYLRQMAALIRSGLAPYQATTEILSRTRNRRLRLALMSMEEQVRAGGSLTPAMTAYPDVFPTKVVGLIYCGELGGFLDNALDEAATNMEEEASGRLWPRLTMGFLRLNVLFGILMFPMVRLDIILPEIARRAKPDDSLSDSLHNASGALSDVFMHGFSYTFSAFMIMLIATYAWPHIKRIPVVRRRLDLFIINLPIWGPLHKSRSLSAFGKSLARLYSAGISPGPAWAAASSVCPNSVIANQLRFAGANLESGGTVSMAVESAGVFDLETVGLLASGERAGDIPGMLQKMSQYQDSFASAQRTKGRGISTSAFITTCLILVGLFLILIVKGYVDAIFKIPDIIVGGS